MKHRRFIDFYKTISALLVTFIFVTLCATDLSAARSRFQLEIFGGFSSLFPSDLNLLVDADLHNISFYYDEHHRYLEAAGSIYSWNNISSGELKKIRGSFPIGARIKYRLNSLLALSVGVRYLSRESSSEYRHKYIRNSYNNGTYLLDSKNYSPYILAARAVTAQVGIHFIKKISPVFQLEAYLSGGPLFGSCLYDVDWNIEWAYRSGGNPDYELLQNQGSLREEGRGTGIGLDGGVRFNWDMTERLGLFFEAGYAYQTVAGISGSGREANNNTVTTWNGEWGVIDVRIEAPWGETGYELPSNYWNQPGQVKARDFILDLSGYQMRVGVFLRL